MFLQLFKMQTKEQCVLIRIPNLVPAHNRNESCTDQSLQRVLYGAVSEACAFGQSLVRGPALAFFVVGESSENEQQELIRTLHVAFKHRICEFVCHD
jgi:hypothetical protein